MVKALGDLIAVGVGTHHAALEISDRSTVEQLFLAGDLPVVCTTSTLALGVNLPAHLVIIKVGGRCQGRLGLAPPHLYTALNSPYR